MDGVLWTLHLNSAGETKRWFCSCWGFPDDIYVFPYFSQKNRRLSHSGWTYPGFYCFIFRFVGKILKMVVKKVASWTGELARIPSSTVLSIKIYKDIKFWCFRCFLFLWFFGPPQSASPEVQGKCESWRCQWLCTTRGLQNARGYWFVDPPQGRSEQECRSIACHSTYSLLLGFQFIDEVFIYISVAMKYVSWNFIHQLKTNTSRGFGKAAWKRTNESSTNFVGWCIPWVFGCVNFYEYRSLVSV